MPEGLRSPYPIDVVWEGEKRFRGGIPDGPTVLMDGDRRAAPSPVDTLLVSLGTCSAIDVVDILEKRRTPARSLTVRLEFSRAPSPPRRLTEVQVRFRVETESERHHVERAVELSFEKYCSVASSLAPDTQLSWDVEMVPPGSAEVSP
ncbi:MAG: OsmC family protein [Gemmatimonadota bacterium]